MSGLSVNLTLEGMDLAMDFATRLAAADMGELREGVGGVIESQTKRRIMSEKTSPDGEAWADNGRDNPIMDDTGALNDSIAYTVAGEVITVGASVPYAAQRQFGGVIKAVNAQRLVFTVGGKTVAVPQVEQIARPFLGVSTDNMSEIESEIDAFLREVAA